MPMIKWKALVVYYYDHDVGEELRMKREQVTMQFCSRQRMKKKEQEFDEESFVFTEEIFSSKQDEV